MNTRLYDILEINKNASDIDIKKAYRKLVMKYHPDKTTDKNKAMTEEKFKEISHAYEILSDPSRRQKYDIFGEDCNEQTEIPKFNMFDFCKTKKKPNPLIYDIEVTLEEIYSGTTKKINIEKHTTCSECNGMRTIDVNKIIKCEYCNGRGVLNIVKLSNNIAHQIMTQCNKCKGNGKTILEDFLCKKCNGIGVVKVMDMTDIDIPKGKSLKPIILENMGEKYPDVDLTGDVIVEIIMKKHDIFSRKGSDLIYRKKINIEDALCGIKFVVTHLDDRKIVVKYDEIIDANKKYYVRDAGMPKEENCMLFGDMIIIFEMVLPKQLSLEQKKIIKETLKTNNDDHDLNNDDDYYETYLNEYFDTNTDNSKEEQYNSKKTNIQDNINCVSQ